MGIKLDKTRTNSYIGTFHYSSADDMLQLVELRKLVSGMNKMVKSAGYNYSFYIKVQGRGKNRFERAKDLLKSRYNGISDRAIKRMSAQTLPVSCAEYVDAYIYRRY